MNIVDWAQIVGAFIAVLTFVGWLFLSWPNIEEASKKRFSVLAFLAAISVLGSGLADFLQIPLMRYVNSGAFPNVVQAYGALVVITHVSALVVLPLLFAGLLEKNESSCMTIVVWGVYLLALIIFGFHAIEALQGKPFGFQIYSP